MRRRTTLAYPPLFVLPLKKATIDGTPILQWLMPILVEWLVERDWWVQTHWEDSDSREVYRQLLRSPILRDMISIARMYRGARAMIVRLDQVPPPEEQKPTSANVFTVSLTMHRFLITSQELEVLYDMMSADYLLNIAIRACFDTSGTIKTEMTMRAIMWNMAKETKRAKLHKVDAPAVQEIKTVSFQLAECYEWDHRSRLRKGDDPRIRSTMEDEILLHNAGSAWNPELGIRICFRLTQGTVLLIEMLRPMIASGTFEPAIRSQQMTS